MPPRASGIVEGQSKRAGTAVGDRSRRPMFLQVSSPGAAIVHPMLGHETETIIARVRLGVVEASLPNFARHPVGKCNAARPFVDEEYAAEAQAVSCEIALGRPAGGHRQTSSHPFHSALRGPSRRSP